MAYLLNILGATAIGGFVIFMVLQINIRISDSSNEMLLSTVAKRKAFAATEIIQFDFYKIGFRQPSNQIAIADSNRFKFYSDIDNNGTKDSILYWEGSTSLLMNTSNPNDKPLYRNKNNGTNLIVSLVSDFQLSYFDSIGNAISYSNLLTQSQRNKIRTIQLYVSFESEDKIGDYYQGIEWLKIIRPKSIASL